MREGRNETKRISVDLRKCLTFTVLIAFSRCAYVIKCQTLWNLAKDVSANAAPYDVLPSACKRLLYKALVIAGSARFQGATSDGQWTPVSDLFMVSSFSLNSVFALHGARGQVTPPHS